MPFNPPFVTIIQGLAQALADLEAAATAQTTALQAVEAAVAALQEDIEINKNLSAYHMESFYGANAELTDIINNVP